MGLLGTIGSLVGLIPGIGTAVGTGMNALDMILGKGGGGGGGGGGSSLFETALPSLIEGGTGLLGGWLAGEQSEKERKQKMEDWQKKRDIISKDLKPKLERYNIEKDFGTLDPLFKKLVVGGLSESLSGDRAKKYGIDFSSILGALGGGPTLPPGGGAMGTVPAGTANIAPMRARGKGILDVDSIMQKYGLGGAAGGGMMG